MAASDASADHTQPLALSFTSSLADVPAADWARVVNTDYPFLRHDFLLGLETSGCTTSDSGWQPCHALLHRGTELVALMPAYLKSHSYGEYVFDWSWADAWQRMGLSYYPKLVCCIPFTPATGPRLCIAPGENEAALQQALLEGTRQWLAQREISSFHCLFPTPEATRAIADCDTLQREAVQFHWRNDSYTSFDDFLARFSSRKRKTLKRERRRVTDQGISMHTFEGDAITPEHWQRFHYFYQRTYAKRSGHGGYLTREFFLDVAPKLGQQVILVLARQEEQWIAGALYFRSGDTLYGRYWGCEQELDCLHFEACYYQGIEYCIRHGLTRFDAGAQGEHKLLRGFEPVTTYSNHWIADPRLREAVAEFLQRERRQNQAYQQDAAQLLPFKAEPGA